MGKKYVKMYLVTKYKYCRQKMYQNKIHVFCTFKIQENTFVTFIFFECMQGCGEFEPCRKEEQELECYCVRELM